MRAGFMVMTQKQSSGHPNGKVQDHKGPKWLNSWKAVSRAWRLFSVTSWELCIDLTELLWCFMVTVWSCEKETTWPMAGKKKKLADSLWQCPCSQCTQHLAVFCQEQNDSSYSSYYSPDLAPGGTFLFPKLKMKLKKCHFDNIEVIQIESLVDILIEVDFHGASQQWRQCWDQFIGWWWPVGVVMSFYIFIGSV